MNLWSEEVKERMVPNQFQIDSKSGETMKNLRRSAVAWKGVIQTCATYICEPLEACTWPGVCESAGNL